MKTEKFPSTITVLLLVVGCMALAVFPGCAFFQKVEADASAVAKQFIADPKGYLESVAVQLQHYNTIASDIVNDTDTVLQAAGLAPANSEQQKLIDDLKKQLATVQGRVTAVNAVLSPSHLDSIANPPSAMLKLHTTLRPPHGSIKPESAFDLSVCDSKNK